MTWPRSHITMGQNQDSPHLLSPSPVLLPSGTQASVEATLSPPSTPKLVQEAKRTTLHGAPAPSRALCQVIREDILLLIEANRL